MATAQRLSFSRWKDPRLAFGVLLMSVSAIAGSLLMQGPDTSPIYQAAGPLVPGTELGNAELVVVDVPAQLAHRYVGPADGVDDRRISHVVGEGELISKSAMEADAVSAGHTHLVVPLMAPAPAILGKGSTAELWRINQEQAGGEEAGAQRIASGLVIVSIASADSMRIDQYSAEIQVPNEDVPNVLAVLGSPDGLVLAKGGGQ